MRTTVELDNIPMQSGPTQNELMQKEEEKQASAKIRGPLFVVGMWRSGTSLFYALLNQHPEIALMYEDELPLLWPLFLGSKPKSDWPERWEFWNSAPTRHQIELNDLPRNASTLREACESIWKQHADGAIGGCKSPNYFDMLPGLATAFPDAKFIVLWRNPMDVCRSVMRASEGDPFFAKRGMVLRVLHGYHDLKLGFDALVANGTAVHQVEYEKLVSDPAHVMEGVCRFLGLEFHPRMVSLKDADRSAIYDAAHHDMVKSGSITAGTPRSEHLPPSVRHKIKRYVAFWHRRYNGQWPPAPENTGSKPGSWFSLEYAWDSLLYRLLRTLDWGIVFVYCFAPLALLRKYRSARGRGETVEVRKKSPASASPNTEAMHDQSVV